MNNSNEKSLLVIEKKGIFIKIINFFKKILGKDNTSYIVPNNDISNEPSDKNLFLESIKFQEAPDTVKLLKIQNELEKRGINAQNAFELTKDLSEEEKQKLETLYKDQIKELELSLEEHKNKIISLRNKLAKSN